MSLIAELKRRNVIRAATAYAVMAWLVIQVAETVLPFFGFSDDAIRNVIVLLGIGFVPAVVLAWTFQVTPGGIKRDRGARELVPDASAMRKLDRAIIAVLLVGISFFAFDKFVLAPERAAEREAEVAERAKAEAVSGYYGDRSIAVLPFENMSADPEQQYFVDGVAEEVLNLLARIRQLRVISRSSSFALRDLDLDVPEIAERLDVGHVLEGSVRKIGNTVRVTAQLIEAHSDTHLWSKTYERELENVFAIQDEIAADVANNLKIELLRPLHSRMVDPKAVALTQQARQIFERRPADTGKTMSELIAQAIEIDRDYVTAWQWKIYADYFLKVEGLISAEEEQRRDREARRHILDLEPESGFIDRIDGADAEIAGRLEDAAVFFERSLSKDANNSETARLAGRFAREIGKFDVAIRLGEHSVAIDPLCYQCLIQLSRTYMYAGDYGAAIDMRQRALALTEVGKAHYGLMLLLQGKAGEALENYQSMESDNLQKYAGLAMAYHDLGNHGSAEGELARLMSTDGDETALLVAEAAAWMDKRDIAFEWLKRAVKDTDAFGLGGLRLMNPAFRNLRDDPRWDEFLESVGFSSARLDAIKFNPVLPE
jgi:TolB-like protein/tetratricopeptide (TPR) repeat protein